METYVNGKAAIKRLIAGLMIMGIIATGCSDQADTTSSGLSAQESAQVESTADDGGNGASDADNADTADIEVVATTVPEEATDTAEAEEEIGKATDVEVFGLASHGGGSQVEINRIEYNPSGNTIVHGTFLNGMHWDTSSVEFDEERTTVLFDDTGATYPLIEGWEIDFELFRGDRVPFSLVFESPAESAQFVGVELNNRPDDEQDGDERSPGFVVPATMDFRNGDTRPPLPDGLSLEDVKVHPSQVNFAVRGVGFSETNIALGFTFTNAGTFSSSLDDNTPTSIIEDDLGNIYRLQHGPGDELISIREGEIASGVLVFGGRIHPDATSISFTLTPDGEVDADADDPRFDFGPWQLDGTFEAPREFESVVPADNIVHPNGLDVTVHRIDFETSRSVVELTAINNIVDGEKRDKHLNKATAPAYLGDDLGNRYPIEELIDRDALSPTPGEGIEGRFTFSGRIDPNATQITLHFNNDADPDAFAVDTIWPEFTFGPYPIELGAAEVAEVAVPTNFGSYSEVNFGEIEVSEVAQVQILVSEFDGILIPGGVQLTLPEGILFDVAKADLRPEARETIDKLLEILDFYEGDPITILGHTDSDGSDDYNLDLSQRRATSVVDALANGGIPSSLLSADARGESQPVADNGTPEGRQENRRVEVQIMTDKGLPGQ